MSIETARIEWRRSPSSSKNACNVWALRPGEHHTIAPVLWSTTLVR
jgi:L-arabinose isomerase